MKFDYSFLREQYEFVRESRRVLLDYCKTISPADLLKENSSFGRGGSIRNLLVHITNTYKFWIGERGLQKEVEYKEYETVETIDDLNNLFIEIDNLIFEFIKRMEQIDNWEIDFELNGTKGTAAPFRLFTHVITHEFHHKGQILSISRHLGYIPVDTDVMR